MLLSRRSIFADLSRVGDGKQNYHINLLDFTVLDILSFEQCLVKSNERFKSLCINRSLSTKLLGDVRGVMRVNCHDNHEETFALRWDDKLG